MNDFSDAMKCAERALALAKDLDHVRSPGDLRQIAGGLRHELDCVIQRLSDGLDALTTDATADRSGKVRSDARETSRAAAEGIRIKSGTQRAKILTGLYQFGDQTDRELQERLAIDQNSERPRRIELVDGGYVAPALFADGTARMRTHRGTEWQIWTLTTKGVVTAQGLLGEPTSGKRSGDDVAAPQLF